LVWPTSSRIRAVIQFPAGTGIAILAGFLNTIAVAKVFLTDKQFYREVRAYGAPAGRHAASELLEPFRNIVRFPPVHPWRVRRRIQPNLVFSQSGDRVETREA
jgi:hypothetical protein